MAKLINVELAIADLKEIIKTCSAEHFGVSRSVTAFRFFVEWLSKRPVVDAVPVVHGRWEWYREENCVICSECKEVHYLGAYHQYSKNFCPNCGARMDLKE